MNINQNTTVNENMLSNLLSKYGKYTAELDESLIKFDIQIVEAKLKTEKNRLKIESYKEIGKYLNKLLSMTKTYSDDTFEMSFETDTKKIGGFPVETIKIDETLLGLRLEYLDYIKLIDSKYFVRLNYRNLMSGLALEIGRDDLGFSIQDVEDTLRNTSLVSINDSSSLDGLIGGEDLSRTLAGCRIGDSEYYDRVHKTARSYFLDKVRDNISYAGMMDSTMKKAIALITCNILSSLVDYNKDLDVKLLAVYDDEIVISLSELDNKILEIINKPVCALILGRKFVFNTSIRILEREHRDS